MDKMWQPERKAAVACLEEFLPRAGAEYAAKRNYDFGPDNRGNTSLLSPYLRLRLVLEDEVLAKVQERYSFSKAEKFIQEILWRTYWKGWLERREGLWQSYLKQRKADLDTVFASPSLKSSYEDALCGKTGIECFNFWVEELQRYGYLHNHARMWFASIWIFTLKLPGPFVTLGAPVGPTADFLKMLEERLSAQGKKLYTVWRTWDRKLYPLAESGFFSFYKKARKSGVLAVSKR